jgi:hypothetical protein
MFDRLLTTITALAVDAPFAVASSPSAWNRFWSAIGATSIGAKSFSPNSVTLKSRSSVGTSIRGRSVMRSKAARFPPATSANAGDGSFSLACSSYSSVLTSSNRGTCGTGGLPIRSA